MYTIKDTIKLPDTDAAGILFFGNYFRLAHDVYESFLDTVDFPLSHVLTHAEVLLLIAHAECDYKTSLKLAIDLITSAVTSKRPRSRGARPPSTVTLPSPWQDKHSSLPVCRSSLALLPP